VNVQFRGHSDPDAEAKGREKRPPPSEDNPEHEAGADEYRDENLLGIGLGAGAVKPPRIAGAILVTECY
jgi:hypothetical protein